MDPLIEGYRRFRAEIWPAERARYEALAHWGQSPETMVIACSDSRVDPQTVFGAVPGELFVVRNVAALVPPFAPDAGYHGTSAALEFAVKVLKVASLVVLGHGQCGGVRAMVYGPPPQARDFIASWVELGKPALAAAGELGGGAPRQDRGGSGAALDQKPHDVPLDRRRRCRGPAQAAGLPLRRPHRRAGERRPGRARADGLVGRFETTAQTCETSVLVRS